MFGPSLLEKQLPYALGVVTTSVVWGVLEWGWFYSLVLGFFVASLAAAALKETVSWTFRHKANPNGKDTCVITGGTHGIGGEIAKVFARDGYNLIIIARYEDELQQQKRDLLKVNPNITIVTIAKNLYSSNGADEVFDEIFHHPVYTGKNLHINHLVNNVGMCIRGEFLDLPLIDQLGMMHLNMTNCVRLSHKFGNRFKYEIDCAPTNTSKFRIMNLASFASLIPCPFMSVYAGTKAFVHFFSVSFAEELKASKYKNRITCTSLCPGYTASPALAPSGIPHSIAWALHNKDMPTRVARAGYKAMMDGQYYVLVGFLNNVVYWITSSVLPVQWTSKLGKFFNADWEDFTWEKLQKEGLSVSHGWDGNSVSAKDLRAGFSTM